MQYICTLLGEDHPHTVACQEWSGYQVKFGQDIRLALVTSGRPPCNVTGLTKGNRLGPSELGLFAAVGVTKVIFWGIWCPQGTRYFINQDNFGITLAAVDSFHMSAYFSPQWRLPVKSLVQWLHR